MTTIDALTADQRALLARYADAVRSSPHNLLSRRGLEELETRHIPESVAFAQSLPADVGAVLDLGTGGGLPGMVVAIVRPDLDVTLLDATKKKIAFLRETADALGVAVATVAGRAEDLQRDHAGAFGVVTARAVAALDVLVGWALPFLRPGGELHAIKGARWAEELRAALPAIKAARASVAAVPESDDDATSDVPVAPRVVIIRAPG